MRLIVLPFDDRDAAASDFQWTPQELAILQQRQPFILKWKNELRVQYPRKDWIEEKK